MNPSTFFLRKQWRLPDTLSSALTSVSDGWMSADGPNSRFLFEARINSAGWRCIWISGERTYSRLSRTAEKAMRRVTDFALQHVSPHFNTAEIEVICLSRYLGVVALAKIKLRECDIRKYLTLNLIDEITIRQLHDAWISRGSSCSPIRNRNDSEIRDCR